MLGYVTSLWLMLAGICVYASLIHLQMGLRKPIDRIHAWFGLLALVAAICAWTTAQLVTSTSPAEYLRLAWRGSTLSIVLFGLVPIFVNEYATRANLKFGYAVSAAYACVLAINWSQPYSMLLAAPPELIQLTLPWGDVITRSSTPPTPWSISLWLAHALLLAYLVFTVIALFRQGPRHRARGLIVCAAPFVASLWIDLLVAFKVVELPYFSAFGFFALVVLMSMMLSNEWRRSHKQMQVILDNAPIVVSLKHVDGQYLFINRQFQTLYGLQGKQIIGQRDSDLFDASRALAMRKADDQLLVPGNSGPLEAEEIVSYGGVDRTYASVRFALVDDGDSAYAVCTVSTDVTERKAAADILRELATSLERRVAIRTRDLAQVNQELEAFSYSVSHDLRAPLMTVHGFTDLLIRDHARTLDTTAQKYLQRIRDGATRMNALIDDLLKLSRVTREQLQRQTLDLAVIAHDVVNTLKEAHTERRVIVEIDHTMPVHGDPRLLTLVLTNLFENAWKYTGRCAQAHVKFTQTSHNGESVFCVRDNGAGFDPKQTEKLFQPFRRLHSERDFPGTGLGLATVARIVHRHGGRIWAEAKLDEGACFYFTIPSGDDEPISSAQSATAANASTH